MALTIMSPLGSATTVFRNDVMAAGVRWDPAFSHGVDIAPDGLFVTTRGNVTGRGACVAPEIAQSTGKIYWECTWTGLLNSSLACGIGICTIEAIADFDVLTNGTGGATLRPNGDVYAQIPNGFPPGFYPLLGYFPTLSEGDTIGFVADFTLLDEPIPTLSFLGVGGTIANTTGGLIFMDPGNYIPCAVFDSVSVFEILAVTANFGANPNTFLGPSVFPALLDGTFTLGWPNTP